MKWSGQAAVPQSLFARATIHFPGVSPRPKRHADFVGVAARGRFTDKNADKLILMRQSIKEIIENLEPPAGIEPATC
jgi:hypothetical protein